MSTKNQDGTFDCPVLEKIKPGEPFFVLRGQDMTSGDTVRDWIGRNRLRLGNDHPKIIEAGIIAVECDMHLPRKFAD